MANQHPGEGEIDSSAWRLAVYVNQAGNMVTLKLNADEVTRMVVKHCRREMGMLLPEGRAFALMLTADWQEIRKIMVQVKIL